MLQASLPVFWLLRLWKEIYFSRICDNGATAVPDTKNVPE